MLVGGVGVVGGGVDGKEPVWIYRQLCLSSPASFATYDLIPKPRTSHLKPYRAQEFQVESSPAIPTPYRIELRKARP